MISPAWIGTVGIIAIEGSYLPQTVRAPLFADRVAQ